MVNVVGKEILASDDACISIRCNPLVTFEESIKICHKNGVSGPILESFEVYVTSFQGPSSILTLYFIYRRILPPCVPGNIYYSIFNGLA